MNDEFSEFFDEGSTWEGTDSPENQSLPPVPPKSRRDMRRARERRHRRTLVSTIAIVAVLVLVFGLGYAGFTKLKQWGQSTSSSQIADYEGPGEGSVSFTIESGQGALQVAKNLVAQDIIKSQEAFTSAVSANQSTLYPGTYELKRHMRAMDVLKIVSDQSKAGGFLEVKAGERVSDILDAAAKISGIDRAQFQSIVDAGGQGILPVEAGGEFEGWFEPGTYNVVGVGDAGTIMKAMVDKRIAKLDAMGMPTGAERQRLLNIASIAESEVNLKQYYGKVTRVILNRLNIGMSLGMDSTVAYGANVAPSQLTNAQLNDASNPYNTRIHQGLPPTPISCPGDDAIEAALHPEDGDWLYFVTTNLQTGETKFTASAEEFQQFVQEYKTTNPNAN